MKERRKKILLGSLQISDQLNWLPYASGCLISYAKRQPGINESYEFLDPLYQFRSDIANYGNELQSADILGLTNYVWNQKMNDKVAQLFKKINPHGTVVYGGPNIPENARMKMNYDTRRPWVDVSIPGLGEIAFSEWLQNKPFSNEKLREVPTPYSDGIFDNLLRKSNKGNFRASIETNRGCPYSCSFCDWGQMTRSKIVQFEVDDVKRQLDWLYAQPVIEDIDIIDANYGILKRDVDIIEYLIECQHREENPINITFGGLAKNGSKHLPIILDMIARNAIPTGQIVAQQFTKPLHGDKRRDVKSEIIKRDSFASSDYSMIKLSFQTHTPEVLKVAQRDNIKNDKLRPLIDTYRKHNQPIMSEMIIALPGETASSWLDTIHYNHHALDIEYIKPHILFILPNTALDDPEYQKQYKIKTKKIRFGGAVQIVNEDIPQFGRVHREDSNEYEIVRSCYSYDVEELVKMFDYNWFYYNLINTDLFRHKLRSTKKDTLKFFKHLNKMPLFEKLIERQRKVVRKIFSDTAYTNVDDEKEIAFLNSSIRFDDDIVLKNNKIEAEKLLNKYVWN